MDFRLADAIDRRADADQVTDIDVADEDFGDVPRADQRWNDDSGLEESRTIAQEQHQNLEIDVILFAIIVSHFHI